MIPLVAAPRAASRTPPRAASAGERRQRHQRVMAESRIAVYGALAANIAIAITKFVAAGLSGSSAMLSEGIHSTVDACNSVLLLVGIRASQRKAVEGRARYLLELNPALRRSVTPGVS